MRDKRLQKGSISILFALSIVAFVAAAGLAVDIGRIYYVKSEVQSFCDSGSIFATLQLDGTSAGITAARSSVGYVQTIMKWDFATKAVPMDKVKIEFAQGMTLVPNNPDQDSWTEYPSDPSKFRFARVTASVPVPINFLSILDTMQGAPRNTGANLLFQTVTQAGPTLKVSATSAGGQQMIVTYPVGLLPFSPVAWSPASPDNFGLVPGTVYTLRYPSMGGQQKMNVCPGDVDATWIGNLPAQDRGYWGSTSAAALRGEIIDDSQTQTIQIGQVVPMVGGNKNTEGSALAARVAEDSDTTSITFGQYYSGQNGNGRRLIGVPINSGPTVIAPYSNPFTAVGIGAFFLLPDSNYSSVTGDDPICAEYVGPFVQGMLRGGAGQPDASGSTGGYIARLVQ